MPSKALYFPYIRVPQDEWFTRALLYWDTVGTILPGGLGEDPRYVTPWMRALLDHHLLEPVYPDAHLWKVPDLTERFLELLERDEEVSARRGRLDAVRLVRVHVQKLGDLAAALTKAGLARPLELQKSWEIWLEVEARTADLYMAYLAGVLGALEELSMDPLTNRSESLAALFAADTTSSFTLKHANELKISVLEDLLPAPSATIPAQELVDFKAEHGSSLAAFRDRVDGALIDIAWIPDAHARIARARILRNELVRERDQIVRAMNARRWPAIAFGAVAGVVTVAAAVAAPFFVGGGVVAAAFAAPAVVPASYGAYAAARAKPDVGSMPLAYAALAQQTFASD